MDTLRDKRRQDELLKVAEQAASWAITLEEGDSDERAAFAEWIEESPLHLDMFLRATAIGQMGEVLSREDRRTLTDRAMAASEEPNVLPMDIKPTAQARSSTPQTPSGWKSEKHRR